VSWAALLVLAAGAYAAKLAGVLGAQRLVPARFEGAVALLPAALLPALAAVQTFGAERALVIDERAPGLAVATALVLLRAPLIVVLVAATGTTALLRAI